MNTAAYRKLVQQSVAARSGAVWRAKMLAGQTAVHRSISELKLLVAGLFLAFFLTDYLPGVAIVVAAAFCVGTMLTVWRESRAEVKLREELAADAASLGWANNTKS